MDINITGVINITLHRRINIDTTAIILILLSTHKVRAYYIPYFLSPFLPPHLPPSLSSSLLPSPHSPRLSSPPFPPFLPSHSSPLIPSPLLPPIPFNPFPS